jgi:propionyl-CoA carboxylase alpha chain
LFASAAAAATRIRSTRASKISGTLNGAHEAGAFTVNLDGEAVEPAPLDVTWEPGDMLMRTPKGAIQIAPVSGGWRLSHGGMQATAIARSARAAQLAALMPKKVAADNSKLLLCPMPGLIVSINVQQGQDVKAGEPLAVVEAMKMENVLTAEADVTIKKVNAKKGDSLALDDVILEFA